MTRIAVVTPSLPERVDFRVECMESVRAQTLLPLTHIVMIDYEYEGPARMLNRMLPAAKASGAEWIAQLADDDVMLPHHLETLASWTDADIIYSYCRVEGRGGWNPNQPFDASLLERENYIPATTLIRLSVCEKLGWREDAANGYEDHDFWLRALGHQFSFACVQEETWIYRFHGRNLSTTL
ncbi:MAG: hypothetical protein ACO24S_07575 [Ilumatobacteraceae bacterium]